MNVMVDEYLSIISNETGSDRIGGCSCSGTYVQTGSDNYLDENSYISSYRVYTCDNCDLSYCIDVNSKRLF